MYRAFIKSKCAPQGVLPTVHTRQSLFILLYAAKTIPEALAQPHLEKLREAPEPETTGFKELPLALPAARP